MELVKRAQEVGASWITVHGRTMQDTPNSEINFEAVKMIKDTLNIPVFGNGLCYSIEDVNEWKEKTGVDGIMAGRGLLDNPALFKGFATTPKECVSDFYNIYSNYEGLGHLHFHHHLVKMLSHTHTKAEKAQFNNLKGESEVVAFLKNAGYIDGSS